MSKHHALVIDDERDIRELLTLTLGRMDLIVTHLDQQLGRLYRNLGELGFEDATFLSKLSYATFKYSGFGTCFLDYDNDGWRDLFIANGHVLDNVNKYRPDITYAEPTIDANIP